MRKHQSREPGPTVLTAFHGTRQHFDVFQASLRGTFGSGIYLADDFAASQYAGEEGIVLMVEVTLHAPYYYQANFDHDLDLDSPAVDLVRTLFPREAAERLLQSAIDTDAGFGTELQLLLEARGFDGLIADYPDGSHEIIAYKSDQVLIIEPQLTNSPSEPR